jgi:hypothetical protein
VTRVSFSLSRVWLIAAVTLREAARQKLVGLLGLIAMGLVVGVHALRDFNFGASELKFIADFGDGAIAGFGAALTIVLMAQLFFSEIENRTALTLLAKPVWRTEFLLGKFFGVVVVAACFCGLLTATLTLVLWNREAALQAERPDMVIVGSVNYGGLWVIAWLHWLKLVLLSAGTLLVASFAQTQIFAVMLGFAGFVICHLQAFAQIAYGKMGSVVMSVPATLIHAMFPDFQLFTLGASGAWSVEMLARLTIYAVGYAAVALGLAVYAFRQREV